MGVSIDMRGKNFINDIKIKAAEVQPHIEQNCKGDKTAQDLDYLFYAVCNLLALDGKEQEDLLQGIDFKESRYSEVASLIVVLYGELKELIGGEKYINEVIKKLWTTEY